MFSQFAEVKAKFYCTETYSLWDYLNPSGGNPFQLHSPALKIYQNSAQLQGKNALSTSVLYVFEFELHCKIGSILHLNLLTPLYGKKYGENRTTWHIHTS